MSKLSVLAHCVPKKVLWLWFERIIWELKCVKFKAGMLLGDQSYVTPWVICYWLNSSMTVGKYDVVPWSFPWIPIPRSFPWIPIPRKAFFMWWNSSVTSYILILSFGDSNEQARPILQTESKYLCLLILVMDLSCCAW